LALTGRAASRVADRFLDAFDLLPQCRMLFAALAQLLRQGVQGIGQSEAERCQGVTGVLIHRCSSRVGGAA
jgi:hypothetical protein